MATAGQAVVPKFGSWDAENIGYTVFFEKVRDNKAPPAAAPAPAPKPSSGGGGGGGYDFDPYEHYESLSRKVPSRPPSSHGQHQPTSARAPAPVARAGYDFDPYEHYDSLSTRNVPSRPPSLHGQQPTSARAPAPVPGAGGYDVDPYEHYDSLSSRNVPSRPPSSHGHAPAAGYDFDPYEHYENLSARNVPPSRPPSSHGHAAPAPPQQHHRPHHGHGYHRRTGSNGSNAASEASSRGSKFSPPRPYQPRYTSNSNSDGSFPPSSHGHGAQYQHHYGAPRAVSASPSLSPPRHHHHPPPPPLPRLPKPKPSAVPRFGVWDEQNAAMAAQGFTVQFEKVKRHREDARTAPAPPPVQPPMKLLSPDHAAAAAPHARGHGKRKTQWSFMSRMYRCLFPRVRD